MSIDFQKNNFASLSVGDILQYNLLPAALRNEFSESLYMMMELILTRLREDIIRNSIFENLKYLVFKYVFQQVVTEAIHLCRYDDETYTDETSYSDLLSYYNQQFHIGCHFAIITLYVTHGMRYYTA